MPLPISAPAARVIADYMRAKDGQVPRLFSRMMTEDARFVPVFHSESPFGDLPPPVGRAAVTEMFRQLSASSENIVTVVPTETLHQDGDTVTSRWVVAMTRRSRAGGMLGWGSYRWSLTEDHTRARVLQVDFEGSISADIATAEGWVDRLLDLSHPWCAQADLVAAARDIPALRRWLSGGR